MNFLYWAGLVILIAIILTYICKKIFKLDSFLGVFVLLKTKKLMFIVEWLSKKKIIEIFAKIGIGFGFGAFGIDYLNRNKKLSNFKRIVLFLFNTIVICLIIYFLFGGFLLSNPILSTWGVILIIIFTGILGLSGLTLASLAVSGIDIVIKTIAGETAMPGVGLILPGIKMPKIDFLVPWYGWIILIFSAAIHEFFHGAMIKRLKMKIKSIGVILFGGLVPFGAFVEPDEKEVKKKSKHEVIKMYSSGPTSNVLVALVFGAIMLIIIGLSGPLNIVPDYEILGLKVDGVYETITIDGVEYLSPAHNILEKDDLIISINDIDIVSLNNVKTASSIDQENKFVIQNIDTKEERIEYIQPNEKGTYGFQGQIYVMISDSQEIVPITNLANVNKHPLRPLIAVLMWIALLNFLIASVNFLPTVPFDGGFMSQVIFTRYLKKGTDKKKKSRVAKFFGWLILFLLILNVVPYFL
jgi:Zn-dependent protease